MLEGSLCGARGELEDWGTLKTWEAYLPANLQMQCLSPVLEDKKLLLSLGSAGHFLGPLVYVNNSCISQRDGTGFYFIEQDYVGIKYPLVMSICVCGPNTKHGSMTLEGILCEKDQ